MTAKYVLLLIVVLKDSKFIVIFPTTVIWLRGPKKLVTKVRPLFHRLCTKAVRIERSEIGVP
jgi:hypothetical protein